jgi:hypothetical protein
MAGVIVSQLVAEDIVGALAMVVLSGTTAFLSAVGRRGPAAASSWTALLPLGVGLLGMILFVSRGDWKITDSSPRRSVPTP